MTAMVTCVAIALASPTKADPGGQAGLSKPVPGWVIE